MKIYIDTNILSNLIGGVDRLSEETGIALQKLAASDHEFITSPLMQQEMEKATNPQKEPFYLSIKYLEGLKTLIQKHIMLLA
jgi:hypothetical protein